MNDVVRRIVVPALASSVVWLGCGGAQPAPDSEPAARRIEATPRTVVQPTFEPLGEFVLLEQRSESPLVTIRVSFAAGSADDPSGREGITNLTSRLMVEGGAGELSYAQVAERLYPMAGEIWANVDRDQTVFAGRVHRDHLAAFYPIFRDVLAAPRMADEDFARIKNQVTNELTVELRNNDDEELSKQAMQWLLYAGHPYAAPELGREQTLSSLTADDVRAHRTRVFCAGRATVGVAGNYPEDFAARLRADLGRLAYSTCVGRRVLPVGAVEHRDSPSVLLVERSEAESSAISMGLPIDVTREHSDYPALTLAAAYLGQHRQFAGILMKKMRGDRGLNYGDYAYSEHFVQEGWGRFPLPNITRRHQYFSIWIRPVQVQNAHFATRMAVRELRKFVETGMSEADFQRIRTFASGYYSLYLQTESRRLGYAIDDRLYGVDRPFAERLREAWANMTVADVNAAVRRHVHPSGLRIAIVTPDANALMDAIAAERPSPITYESEKPEDILIEDREIQDYRLGIYRDAMRIIRAAEIFR